MAQLVKALLDDLGLYGAVPATFPELITWIVTVTAAVSLVAGIIKTISWAISNMTNTGRSYK